VNVKPDPILAAAMIWTANPQSTEATLAIFPMVLESNEINEACNEEEELFFYYIRQSTRGDTSISGKKT